MEIKIKHFIILIFDNCRQNLYHNQKFIKILTYYPIIHFYKHLLHLFVCWTIRSP